ncbi:MAG: gliding motility-associated C-terminal domain-containing protein [Bacteroidia bacterium]|nr:gliding motility-associated C-terminal domain-containing protein [Bacteroidia bacterium]
MQVRLLCVFLLLALVRAEAQPGIWTWVKGQSTTNSSGNFGTLGVPSPTNAPPALYAAAAWTDLQGNFWMYGGCNNFGGYTASMWRYEPATGNWTCMTSALSANGSYGVQGVPSPTNHPPGRGFGMIAWTDLSGDLWMFGGSGLDVNFADGRNADLWRYNIATNTWTWMKGPNITTFGGNFGVIGVPSPSNEPPSRDECRAGWVDNNGDLWLFGGFNNIQNNLDDVWRYNIATNTWTWMAGTGGFSPPVNYGTLGVAAPSNNPGGRTVYAHWKDQNGRFWIMSGGYSLGGVADANDIWMFDPVTLLWTWMGGSNVSFSTGNTGPLCTFSTGYAGAARNENSLCWTDDCNRLWYYGGANPSIPGNDMWVIDISTVPVQQAIVRGQNNAQSIILPVHGTQNVPAATNDPGGRFGSMPFRDLAGNFWLFGGKDGQGFTNYNDLWKYVIDPACPVTPQPLAAASGLPLTGCAPLTVNFQNTGSGSFFAWDFGDGNTSVIASPTHTYTNAGTYIAQLVATDTSCGTQSDTVALVITVSPSPVPDLGADTVRCTPAALTLNAGGPWNQVLWSNGSAAQSITVTDAGTYSVTVTDSTGCSGNDSIRITDAPRANISSSGTFCTNINLQLNAGAGNNFAWNTGDSTATITITAPGTYAVTVTTGSCISTDSISISGQPGEGSVYLPNSFTPNNDGLNETFRAEGTGITVWNMRIYNRWGEMIFETDNFAAGWDGRIKNTLVQEDVYVYVIDYVAACDGAERRRTGRVTVVR